MDAIIKRLSPIYEIEQNLLHTPSLVEIIFIDYMSSCDLYGRYFESYKWCMHRQDLKSQFLCFFFFFFGIFDFANYLIIATVT
jgi:hypothetical protein